MKSRKERLINHTHLSSHRGFILGHIINQSIDASIAVLITSEDREEADNVNWFLKVKLNLVTLGDKKRS